MKRDEWRGQSNFYAKAARTLLKNGHFSVAYHLAGIAIECALKAVIAKRFKANEIPEKRLVDSIYQHRLAELILVAQLAEDLAAEEVASLAFQSHWATLKTWQVDSRYKNWTAAEATEMVNAATMRRTGMLAWIKRRW